MKSKMQWVVLFSFVVAVIAGALAGGGARPVAAMASCNSGQRYAHDMTVSANGVARADKTVEVRLNLTPLLAAQGGSGGVNLDSLCVDEIDGEAVMANDVVFQFDPASDYDASSKARGTLTLLMNGNTGANATRGFRLYFDTATGFALPPFADLVELTDEVSHKGYDSLRLVTVDAEYFYHKPGGGFATLIDRNNNDWIDWNTAAGGAGDFRGIPNMVHPNDGGFFHPGRNNVTTTVLSDGPLKASFKSVSKGDTSWEVVWDVFPTYVRMTVVRKGVANFWWLYEGTPGGVLEPAIDRLTRSDGSSIKASGTWTTDIPGDEWIFVTDPNVGANGRSLFLIHHQNDTKIDGYTPDGTNRMTIFGFGRSANQRQLNTLPQQFTFGFVDETTLAGVEPAVNSAYKPLNITGENDAGDDPGTGPVCSPLPFNVYASPKSNILIGSLKVANEDVAKYDGATCEWSLVFDGTAAGLPGTANVDALAVDAQDLYLSFTAAVAVPGISGLVDDSDIVRYSGGSFSLYLDGSAFGLTTDAEDIDAIAFDETGKLLVSTLGAAVVPGVAKSADEDLLRFDNGTWQIRFDGSHNAGLAAEDVAGADVESNGDIYLSVLDAFSVPGANGNGTNIFMCAPSSLGFQSTNCTYSLVWRSASFGLSNFNAFDIE